MTPFCACLFLLTFFFVEVTYESVVFAILGVVILELPGSALSLYLSFLPNPFHSS